jgi:hypothetical protein
MELMTEGRMPTVKNEVKSSAGVRCAMKQIARKEMSARLGEMRSQCRSEHPVECALRANELGR